jgi:hypothetical protein
MTSPLRSVRPGDRGINLDIFIGEPFVYRRKKYGFILKLAGKTCFLD